MYKVRVTGNEDLITRYKRKIFLYLNNLYVQK